MLECGREYAFPFWEAIGHLEIGRGLLHEGHPAEAIEETRYGLEIHQRTGAQLSLPYHHGSLAEAHIQLGQLDRARTTLDEAWTAMRRSEETAHESELYRLEGQLERARPNDDAESAQSCFQQAIEVARRQHCKSYELRAALGRAKAYPPVGNGDPNFRSLAEIYNWFSEGLQMPDQVEAASILAQYS